MAKTFRSILSERVFILLNVGISIVVEVGFARWCSPQIISCYHAIHYIIYHAASSEIVGRVLIVHESITHGLGLDQQHPLHGRTIILLA